MGGYSVKTKALLSLTALAALVVSTSGIAQEANQQTPPPLGSNPPATLPAPGINPPLDPNQPRPIQFDPYNQMAERFGASETEKTAIKEMQDKKATLTNDYTKELTENFRLLRDTSLSDEQCKTVLAKIDAAKAKYVSAINAVDTETRKKLSPKIQLLMLSMGALDNGINTRTRTRTPGRQLNGPQLMQRPDSMQLTPPTTPSPDSKQPK
jgi:hypothetical protein